MKKNYTFLLLIGIMFYLLYNILNNEYSNYKTLKVEENLSAENNAILNLIKEKKDELDYKSTKAYNDRINNAAMESINIGEEIIQVVEEKNYNKYNNNLDDIVKEISQKKEQSYDGMTVFQKWVYFVFGKDIRE